MKRYGYFCDMKSRLYNRINSEELKEARQHEETGRITLSFYVYADIKDPNQFRDDLYRMLQTFDVCGRIYVATEGVNAQLNVPETHWTAFEQALRRVSIFRNMRLNIAVDEKAFSFYKLVIKVRPRILADGLPDDSIDFSQGGEHIDAHKFNRLTDQEETILVDMRNHYESEVGHFEGAICPDVETFRESLPIIRDMLMDKKDRPLVMYCTGGIRCEKASAYFRQNGFTEVYQLDGGIIEYTKTIKKEDLPNKFIGKNFVFDERMGERISDDIIARCHQCGEPCDDHVNCANDACHILFIQCKSCAEKYESCCSKKCTDFNALPEERRKTLRKSMTFNGTKFGKGRYKALNSEFKLDQA